MPRRPRRAIRQLAAPLVALLAMTSDANAVFVTLPNPVPLQNESINLLRNSSTVDGDEWKLVVFGFSHCRDICPRSLQTLGLLVGIAAPKSNVHRRNSTAPPAGSLTFSSVRFSKRAG